VKKIFKISYLLGVPTHYFSPLFSEFAKDSQLDFTTYYCSDETVNVIKDLGFGIEIKWDTPLLEGYNCKFLKNHSPRPTIFAGFFGLVNFGIITELKREKYDATIIHGWSNFTNLLAILSAKAFGSKVFLRGENPFSHELRKPLWKIFIKKFLLQYGLFPFVDAFLYIGEENKAFYQYYHVPDKKLFFTPYCVDNKRFYGEYVRLKEKKFELRKILHLPHDKVIILYVAKLIDKKRPLDLLYAYENIQSDKKALVFVGEGYLRNDMEKYVQDKGLKDVYFIGFKNQSEISVYYAIGDIFVLPSGIGETWGLVVNEAMNFGLPIVVSDMVGSGKNLVSRGENGFVFPMGDITKLGDYLKILMENKALRENMGKKSLDIVKKYSHEQDIEGILAALEYTKEVKSK
jgi:glycosyltransferase involved in cell wall biosynthesis